MRIARYSPIFLAGNKMLVAFSPAVWLSVFFAFNKVLQRGLSWRALLPILGGSFLFMQFLLLDIAIYNELGRLLPALLFFYVAKGFEFEPRKVIQIAACLVVLDTATRILIFPSMVFINPLSDGIYAVKNITSIFFFDANLTAIFAFICFCLTDRPLTKITMVLCIYLSFSRSVYAMIPIFLALTSLPYFTRRFRAISCVAAIIGAVMFVEVGYEIISGDGSGKTKLLIYEIAKTFITESPFIGIGSGEFKNNFILASHTIIGQISELGIVGSLIFFFPLAYYLIFSTTQKVYCCIAALIVGGIFGLFPIAYVGWFFLVCEHHQNATKESGHLRSQPAN